MKLTKTPKVGTTYIVNLTWVKADEQGSIGSTYRRFPTLAEARRYALSVRPEYTVTILKPIEYRTIERRFLADGLGVN